MINAIDLCKKQIDKEKDKYKIYDKIYEIIEKKIINASTCNLYYIVYEIPEFLVGYTVYSLNDCNQYIQNKLKNNKFKIKYFEPNILYISWNNK